MFNQEFLTFLSDKGSFDKEMIAEELAEDSLPATSLKQFLLARRYLTETNYQKMLADFLGLEFKDSLPEPDEDLKDEFVNKISHRLAYQHLIFPLYRDGDDIVFAISDISSRGICEEAADLIGGGVKVVLTLEANILNLIQNEYKIGIPQQLDQDDETKNLDSLTLGEGEDLLASDDDEPIRRWVNAMLFQATKANASDIHIDPTADQTVVRNRMDGVLYQVSNIPKYAHNRIINRVKVMAALDISTRNVPQDGRTMIRLAGKKIDIRVSVIPTIHGERVVMRLLQQSHQLLSMDEIGLVSDIRKLLLDAVAAPNGIILVTGPTGSGKTTTIYACLQAIDHNERNVITVEDPVEYQISGYGQVQVNEKQGLTFATGLRSILRQDPDVIMVGEIRDSETAQTAIKSALTGHLVLSTLHTNDAPSTVIRLIDMDIEPFLISSTLKCILSQRLVRKLCVHCRKKVKKSWAEFSALGIDSDLKSYFKGYVYEQKGCEECVKSGYRGRVGVQEILSINDSLRSVITKDCTSLILRNAALKTGAFSPLARDCYIKVFSGITSISEVSRVLFELQQEQMVSATGNI